MKPWETFVVVQPGLEEIAAEEFESLGLKRPTPEFGGFTWVTHPKKLFQILPYLRIPTRVLIRVGTFHARNFFIFEKEFKKLDFSSFLNKQSVHLKVECHHCALYHKGAIAERMEGMLNFGRNVDASLPAQTIQCLGQDNHFTISVDTCGDHLHKRGLLPKRGPAPLRENIAAALIRSLKPKADVWDPFCGSGTILAESLLYHKPQNISKFRYFSYKAWPIYLKSKPEELILDAVTKNDFKLIGTDIDEDALSICKDNLEVLQNQATFIIEKQDFYDIQPQHYGLKDACIIFNPPYGERLPFKELKKQLDAWLSENKNLKVVALLPSSKSLPGAKTLFKIKNGGLTVVAQYLES